MGAEITETTVDEATSIAAEAEMVAVEAEEMAVEAEVTAIEAEEIAAEANEAAAEAEVEAVEAEEIAGDAADLAAEADQVAAEAELTALVTPASIADLKPKMKVRGTVKRVDLYGAIIDLGIDATALVHISQLGTDQVNRVSDVLNEGDTVAAWVTKVDPERGQVMLTMIEPVAVDWGELKEGQVYTGTVTRLENFGAFVNIGAEREGLVHISELSHDYVKGPSEVVSVGDEVTVKVLGFNRRKRRIDLSMKALIERPGSSNDGGGGGRNSKQQQQSYTPDTSDYEEAEDDFEELPTAMEIALRRALGNEGMTAVKSEQQANKKQKKHSSTKRQKQQEVIDRILQMTSEN